MAEQKSGRPTRTRKKTPNTLPQTANPTQEQVAARPLIMGIGASAGGLEALSQLISKLPTNLDVSYVVVQHLSPTYRSMLTQLLGRETHMLVCEVQDDMLPEPNVIYINPASHNIVMKEGRFHLIEVETGVMPRPSINTFFCSLAEEKGDDAVGIILSGTGTDGAIGIRVIKAGGGYTFAQTPETAKYSGMPQAAIDTECVDWVMPPEQIADEITHIARASGHLITPTPPPSSASMLKKLLSKVKQHTKVDFSGYKETTVWRRIERRMAANHVNQLEDYLALVENNPDELEKLRKDVLISVTAFFRDTDAFSAVRSIISRIIHTKQPGDEIRVWVPGCATGEEAYSLAILICEELGDSHDTFRVQVFATDIDLNAMALARRGIYTPGTLSQVDPKILAKYFVAHGDRYEIVKSLREMVVFARQDLVQDPPFLRVDLISCRNLLIYFQNELQAKILSVFHYALNRDGFLFLGRSESISQQEMLFDPFHKESRIFTPRDVARRPPILASSAPYTITENFLPASRPTNVKPEDLYREEAERIYLPSGVLVDANFAIQYVYGDATHYMSITSGKPSFDLLHLVKKEFRADLQTLLHQAQKKMESLLGRPRTVRVEGERETVRLAVHPVKRTQQSNVLFLICFERIDEADLKAQPLSGAEAQSGIALKSLEDELVTTREHLQSVIEELETSNEEMQALNEEVQAANEELQSSNEELESANEELQSTNQELTTINEELQIKTQELAQANDDLENILNSSGIPMMLVNQDMCILRYNKLAANLFGLMPSVFPPRLNGTRLPPGMEDFSPQVAQVMRSGDPIEMAVFSSERHYTLHILPYQSTTPKAVAAVIAMVDNTEMLTAQREMRESQSKLLDIMNHSTSLISLKDLSGRYLFVNQRFEEFFGVKCADILGKTDNKALEKRMAVEFRDRELDVVKQQKPMEFEDPVFIAGEERYLLSIRFPLKSEDGVIYAVCTQSSDITQRKHAEKQLQLAARVFDRAGEGILVTDSSLKILTVNESFTGITGYSMEEVLGKSPSLLQSGRHNKAFYTEMWESIQANGGWQGEIWNRRKNGEVYLEWLTINIVRDQKGEPINYVGIFTDISAIKESQRRIEFLATHDALTSLPNRTTFIDRLNISIHKAHRQNTKVAVLFVDLDNFKLVNDTLGHDAGDQLVIRVAERLRECIREGDTVARFGGDEFAILLDTVQENEINISARRIINLMAEPFKLNGTELFISCSIGISIYPDDAKEGNDLLRHADVAMYRAKDTGKNNHQFFSDEMRHQASERLSFEYDIRRALEENQFFMVYQPQVNIGTGKVAGMEALIRWRHPEHGLVSPAKFIPVAESCGLIDRIGDWIFKAIFSQLADWKQQKIMVPRVSINVSPRHFRKAHIPSVLRSYLKGFSFDPSQIALEFTETALIEDADHNRNMLMELKKLGLHMSLDDFGTGYSSLSYLKKYPIDEIKIDRSFVNDITTDPDDRAIVLAIISMAKTLGLEVVAEGVETQEQQQVLKDHGCEIVQGYLHARPMPAEELVMWLNDFDQPA